MFYFTCCFCPRLFESLHNYFSNFCLFKISWKRNRQIRKGKLDCSGRSFKKQTESESIQSTMDFISTEPFDNQATPINMVTAIDHDEADDNSKIEEPIGEFRKLH